MANMVRNHITVTEKHCNQCNQLKLITEFHRHHIQKDGHASTCKDCVRANRQINKEAIYKKRNEWRRNKYEGLKREAVNYLGGCCKLCGYNKCIASLDFHHRIPAEKEINLSTAIQRHKFTKLQDIIPELNKCDLMCRNCHTELHFMEKRT